MLFLTFFSLLQENDPNYHQIKSSLLDSPVLGSTSIFPDAPTPNSFSQGVDEPRSSTYSAGSKKITQNAAALIDPASSPKSLVATDFKTKLRSHSHTSSTDSSNTTDTNSTLKAIVLPPQTPETRSSAASHSLEITPVQPPVLGTSDTQPRLMLDLEPSSPFFPSSRIIFNSSSQAKATAAHDSRNMLPKDFPHQLQSSQIDEDPTLQVQDAVSTSKGGPEDGANTPASLNDDTDNTVTLNIDPSFKDGSEAVPSSPSTPRYAASPSVTSHGDDYFTPASDAGACSPDSLTTKSSTDVELLPQNSSFQISPASSSTSKIDPALLAAITNTEAQNIAVDFYHCASTFVSVDGYASWMGDEGILQKDTREAYMNLFAFKNKSILAALRDLCEKLYMKGESQQLDRIMESFSTAWDQMNPKHGFLDSNAVYTIAYALLLLNTDLYAADHTTNKKISKSKFVTNTMETIRAYIATLSQETKQKLSNTLTKSAEAVRPAHHRMSSFSYTMGGSKDDTLILVNDCPIAPLSREWQFQIETVLKVFYSSVSKDALELHSSDSQVSSRSSMLPHSGGLASMSSNNMSHHAMASTSSLSTTAYHGNNNGASNSNLMPSVSLTPSTRATPNSSSIFGRLALNRLRANRSNTYDQFNQSRIDLAGDRSADGYRRDSFNSLFSMESTYSAAFGFNKHAVGFAGLLATSMIREDETATEESFGDFSKIEEELAKEVELELLGAPWAKEGLLKYRPYIDPSSGKKSKRKDWTQVFVVVQRGQVKMFKFNTSSSSSANTAAAGGAVGAGNWMESANMVDGFHLCHTMAQELPPTKRSRGYSSLWSLTLPQHGVLVFEAGTKEIAREYVYTCNYWAGRLSKEPFDEPVSSMEYGWGSPLDGIEAHDTTSSSLTSPSAQPRLQHKSSAPLLGRTLLGDRVTIKDWQPSGQSLIVSDLNEEKQAMSLREYVSTAEKNLSTHNALRPRLLLAYTPAGPNFVKAHANWERKSQYLLQQFVRYRIYVDCLEKALADKAIKHTVSPTNNGSAIDDESSAKPVVPVLPPSTVV